jgi:hypothetical protein
MAQRAATHGGRLLHPLQVLLALMAAYYLALMHYLNRTAHEALTALRPAMDVDDAQFANLRYQLTTLPRRSAFLATVLGGAFYLLLLLVFPPFARLRSIGFPASPLGLALIGVPAMAIGAAYAYHTVHQLPWVNHIYADNAQVHFFRLGELYALSRLASRTAIGTSLPIVMYLLLLPGVTRQPVSVAILASFGLLGGLAFLLPLLGIHRRLVEEKERRQNELADSLETTLARLHQRINDAELQGMTELHRALASLEIEHEALERLPTWPWAPGTLRGVVLGLLLPTGVWMLELILERLLGL